MIPYFVKGSLLFQEWFYEKKISVERKALATCLRKELKLSYGDIAKKCGISKVLHGEYVDMFQLQERDVFQQLWEDPRNYKR